MAADHLSLALPLFWRNELKGLGFQGTLQPGSDTRAVHRQEVCGELRRSWLWLVSFLLHHCLVFQLEGSLFSPRLQRGQSLGSRTV